MHTPSPRATTQAGRWGFRVLAASLALCALSATSANAALVISPAPTISGSAGDTGTFEVTVTNTGAEDIFLIGFSLEVSVDPRHGVLFNSAGINTTTPYVFASDISYVAQGFGDFADTNFSSPVNAFVASDLAFNLDPSGPQYGLIRSGETFGLALVGYILDRNISPTAGVVVSIIPDFVYGTAAVPEPSSVVQALLGLSFAAVGVGQVRRRRRHAA